MRYLTVTKHQIILVRLSIDSTFAEPSILLCNLFEEVMISRVLTIAREAADCLSLFFASNTALIFASPKSYRAQGSVRS